MTCSTPAASEAGYAAAVEESAKVNDAAIRHAQQLALIAIVIAVAASIVAVAALLR